MPSPPADTLNKLEAEKNIWVASVRPNGRPHLVPVWFAWHADQLYICIDPTSVKAKNLSDNNRVALALEDGSKPLICEGEAAQIEQPWPQEVIRIFKQKYDWDITSDTQYTQLVAVTPTKWLHW
ncbi:MAG: pyridoxamine 5'-phosphate oxidase family protein [Anaerolineales bacterium]|nr:pyridoxamine 5'-phosphate oxidase family protein [Anaerolineales bacterium]